MTNQAPAATEPAQTAPVTSEPATAAAATEPAQTAPVTSEPATAAQPDYAAIIAAQSEQINQLTATVTKLISGGVQIGAAPPAQPEPPEPEPPTFETVADLGRLIGKKDSQ